jgi:nucleoside phosphorylase/CheY-like chemotaxis protein
MKHILVVDDRWEDRKQEYENVLLPDFNVITVEKGSQVFTILESRKDIDIYIVDIVLSEWINIITKKPLQVMEVLERIPKDKLILLVSNNYDILVKDNELTPLINSILDKKYLVSFFVWSDFAIAREKKKKKEGIKCAIEFEMQKHNRIQKEREANKFDFAVICALPEEMSSFLLDRCSEVEDLPSIERIRIKKATLITETKKELKLIAVIQTNMGMADAAILGTVLTSHFEIRHIFMIGVCGGRKGKVELGSLVIPHKIVAYQRGKLTDDGFISSNNSVKSDKYFGNYIASKGYQSILKDIYIEAQNEIRQKTNKNIGVVLEYFSTDEMICGETVVNKSNELDNIADTTATPKLCAVDMESYSIYRLAELLNIDATVIKAVMDLSSDKTDEYKEYAAKISAKFLYYMLYKEIINL